MKLETGDFMKNSAGFWNSLSKSYDSNAKQRFSQTYNDTYKKCCGYLKPTDTVLDYGCGTGIITTAIAKDVKEIHALDYSDKMIDVAKRKAERKKITNISFITSSIEDCSFSDETFDVVLAANVLCYIKEDERIIRQIHRLLKPDGIFLSVTDCLDEKKSFAAGLEGFLSRIGLLPFIRFYDEKLLEHLVENNQFEILETKNLFESPPNYFIAAKKI